VPREPQGERVGVIAKGICGGGSGVSVSGVYANGGNANGANASGVHPNGGNASGVYANGANASDHAPSLHDHAMTSHATATSIPHATAMTTTNCANHRDANALPIPPASPIHAPSLHHDAPPHPFHSYTQRHPKQPTSSSSPSALVNTNYQ